MATRLRGWAGSEVKGRLVTQTTAAAEDIFVFEKWRVDVSGQNLGGRGD
jgi:hypothetical protein